MTNTTENLQPETICEWEKDQNPFCDCPKCIVIAERLVEKAAERLKEPVGRIAPWIDACKGHAYQGMTRLDILRMVVEHAAEGEPELGLPLTELRGLLDDLQALYNLYTDSYETEQGT